MDSETDAAHSSLLVVTEIFLTLSPWGMLESTRSHILRLSSFAGLSGMSSPRDGWPLRSSVRSAFRASTHVSGAAPAARTKFRRTVTR